MKPKTFIVWILSVVALLSSCADKEVGSVQAQDNTKIEQPAVPQMSADTMNARIARDLNASVSDIKSEITKEALTTIAETQAVLKSLQENKTEEAEKQLYALIGKMETLVAANPEIALLPVWADVQVNEVITDINAIKDITKSAKTAMKKGYYQEARDILEGLASEEIITTYQLPMATYPQGLKLAATLLKNKQPEAAQQVIVELLNTIVITEVKVPIPVLKAEQYIIEAATMNMDDESDRAEALVLLSNAEYQLQFAEALGYGKHNKDYAALDKAIKVLKRSIVKKEAKETIKSSFDSLKERMTAFRKQYFPKRKQSAK